MTNIHVVYDVIFQKTTACNNHHQKKAKSTNLDDTKVESAPGYLNSLRADAELLHQNIVAAEVKGDFDGVI